MALNDIKFVRGQGGMGRRAASEDVISGLIMALPSHPVILSTGLEAGFIKEVTIVNNNNEIADPRFYVAQVEYYQQLADICDIKPADIDYENVDNTQIIKNVIDYHVREFFRMSPTGKLWLGIIMSENGTRVYPEAILTLQNKAEGKIRQVGVLTSDFSDMAAYQAIAAGNGVENGLEQNHRPLSIIVTANGQKDSPENLQLSELVQENEYLSTDVNMSRKNVSMLISCDLDTTVLALLGEQKYGYYGCIGNCLGAVSAASVNECIGWVGKFPLGLKKPGFITGELLTEVVDGVLGSLNEKRYIFVRLVEGAADCYYNDSHTLDVATSDYAYIENVRTMDKATREIRKRLVPFLNSPIKVDAESGKLSAMDIATLENAGQIALDEMEKVGELSGYSVTINPDQNILSTSNLEISIVNVPTGVIRNMTIKIGYAKTI